MIRRISVGFSLFMLCLGGSLWARSVAVIELFTSEGCSSCPSAEHLLNELVREESSSERAIYPLAFHVDYWNYLGWEDRLADPIFTQRQRDYRQRMRLRSIYTPQMIVNGTNQFVGSDEACARKAIVQALNQPIKTGLVLRLLKNKKGTLKVAYQVAHTEASWQLHVTLVEKMTSNEVQRGENRGRFLKHANVVRILQTVALSSRTQRGEVSLRIPRDLSSDYFVMAYVQDAGTGAIVGAQDLKLF